MNRLLGSCVWMAIAAITPPPLGAQGLNPGESRPEAAVMAEALIQMLPYVQWPKESAEPGHPFELVVLGKSPFGRHLDNFAQSQTVQQRPIRIQYVTRLADIARCQALFVCQSEGAAIGKIPAWARANKVLTIAEGGAFMEKGIMVNLFVDGTKARNRVNWAVNPGEAGAGGLAISSQLLQFAQIIESPNASRFRRRP
jgi:hypothetical protein